MKTSITTCLDSALIAAAISILTATAAHAQFTAGEGGQLPAIPELQGTPGQVGGLVVVHCDRENVTFGQGTRASLDLDMLPPSAYEATSCDLQYSSDGQDWTTLFTTGASSQDNFSFSHDHGSYRLLVNDGPLAGQTSNTVFAPVSSVETRFAGWGLNSGMSITGIMVPWLGRGMTASFTVRNLSDDSDVTGGLTYQWYRVNPLNGDAIPIDGATSPTYATTEDDLGGYYFLCNATGDQTTVGGYAQVMSQSPVIIFNRASATNASRSGFTLNLYKSTPTPLTADDLTLSYRDNGSEVSIPITEVIAQPGNAIYNITATIPEGCTGFSVSNQSHYWKMGGQLGEGEWAMRIENLWVDIPSSAPATFSDWLATVTIPTDRQDPLDTNGPIALPNLFGYAMGLDPMLVTSADMPDVTSLDIPAGTMTVVYRRAKAPTDIAVIPQVSSDLSNWTPATITGETVLHDGGDWEQVEATIDYGGGPTGYFRFSGRITQAAP